MKEEIVFQLILHGGNGRSYAMEAINYAKEGNFQGARKCLKKADEELIKAHNIQSKALQEEIRSDKKNPVSLLEVHGQDHLMNAMTVKELASEIIDLYELFHDKVK
jgi:Phosphotransferase system cellobiose-specific component IIA